MRWISITLLLGLLSLAAPTGAAETGRYQAVVLPETGRSGPNMATNSRVLILDTVEGHLWLWGENEAIRDGESKLKFGAVLTYEGRVRPGQRMGEVIDSAFEKK